MTLSTGPVLVLNSFSHGASLLTDVPANDTQNKSCSSVEFIFKRRRPSDECPTHDTQNKSCFGVEFLFEWRVPQTMNLRSRIVLC